MGFKKLGIHILKNEAWLLLHPIYENNSRWITGLNTKPKTIKLLEENKGECLYNLRVGKIS